MRVNLITLLLPTCFAVTMIHAENPRESIGRRSERVVVEESTAVEQAQARARTRSEYGLELRPRVTNSEVGVGLRIYLPNRWNKSSLREQLILVAESEQLRVSALEWQELMEVYRGFCEYRMLNHQIELYEKEQQTLKPYLEKADREVQLNQLAVADRAKLYSLYLDLVNEHARIKAEKLEVEQAIRLLVGAEADLEKMAAHAHVQMPAEKELDLLLKQALQNRSDYRRFDVESRSLSAAEVMAESEDGFRLKYIQPGVEVDYNTGESTYGLSASFVLPWGTRNPDIAVYQQQQILNQSLKELQRMVIKHRLEVLQKSARAYYDQAGARSAAIKPLLIKLDEDLAKMDAGRLADLRDLMLVRERMLDVSLQTTRAICRKEQIAVDFVEELGTLNP
jgi:hypothetical protein